MKKFIDKIIDKKSREQIDTLKKDYADFQKINKWSKFNIKHLWHPWALKVIWPSGFLIFMLLILFDGSSNDTNNNKKKIVKTENAILSSFSDKYAYQYFQDGSCGTYEGRKSFGTQKINKCVSLNEYKDLCNLSEGITRQIRTLAALNYRGPIWDFISSGGDYGNFRATLMGNKCVLSFTISGILKGTSTSKNFNGIANTFIILNNNTLIHTASFD